MTPHYPKIDAFKRTAGHDWEEFVANHVYPEPHKPQVATKYDAQAREGFEIFIERITAINGRLCRSPRPYLPLQTRRLTVLEALDYLNTLMNDSTQCRTRSASVLSLVFATMVTQTGLSSPDWCMTSESCCLFGEPQWAVVGDTFPVGCAFNNRIVYHGSL